MKFTITTSNGLFSGSFTGGFAIGGAPAKALPASFGGVIFQKGNTAAGFYLEGNHSGQVALAPQ